MSDRVQVGIIGTSWWTELMFLPSLESHPGAEIVAICGRDGERTGALARKHNIPLVEISWVLETNVHAIQGIELFGARPMRRFRIFERAL